MKAEAQDNAKKVWDTVNRIPAGRVAPYGLVADLAGLPGRARWIGRALKLSPQGHDLPWHRVLRSNGQIAFAANSEAAKKQRQLLSDEGVVVTNNRVNMRQFGWQPELGDLMEMTY